MKFIRHNEYIIVINRILKKLTKILSSYLTRAMLLDRSTPSEEALDLYLTEPMINPRGMNRKQKLLAFISPSDQDGLEIGPLCWPLVTKSESNGKIYYVDYSTAELLREKYKQNSRVVVDEIVDTDYLWGKQTLPELTEGKLFDYVVASHVIEHVPNMLGWLHEIAEVLKDSGILSLAIPDKRYTFDIKRNLTSLGDVIESYLLNKRRPSPRDIFDHTSLACKVDMVHAWNNEIDLNNLEHMGELNKAYFIASKYLSTEDYQDVHVNILTPTSFLDLLEGFSKLELFDYEIASFHDTFYNSHEFIVSLRRLPRDISKTQKLTRQISNISTVRRRLEISGVNILMAFSPSEIQYHPGIRKYILVSSIMNVGSVPGNELKVKAVSNLLDANVIIQETNSQTGQIIGGNEIDLIEIGQSRTFLLTLTFKRNIEHDVLIKLDIVDSFDATVGTVEIPILFHY